MEGLTAEQAAQAAQWGPDIGPPGPVSYIMNVIQSQQPHDDESAIISNQTPNNTEPTTSGADDSPSSNQAPKDNQPTSTTTPTFDNVSSNPTTLSSSFQTSASTVSTSQETSSSTISDIPSSSSDPATFTNDQPLFSLSIPTTSSTSTSASAESTNVLSYEPIASFSYAPTSTSSFITSSSSTSTPSRTLAADLGAHETDTTTSSDMINMSNSRKQAIVGGLAGAIGALVILGLLLCFCLRRRQKRADDDDENEEDGLKKPVKPMTLGTKASTVRLWTALARDNTARSTPEISRPKTALIPSAIDGSLIRVSTEHWTRPFVREEGMRESFEPAPLRVVNSNTANAVSNSSRSSTPQQEGEGEEGKPGFVRKQRSALATLLQDGARTNSRNAVRRGPISYPKPVAGDPVYSSKAKVEDSAAEAETISVGSLPSDTSSPLVVQQPPEDPFFASTTMLSTMEEVAPPMKQHQDSHQHQPELSRSISHFGKNANPFRTQIVPSVALPPRIFSYSNPNFRASDAARASAHARKSSIGSSYSRRQTAGTTILPSKRSSDQFDLMVSPDQMPPASGILAKTAEFEKKEEEKMMKEKEQEQTRQQQREEMPAESSSPEGSSPNWYVYEGT